MKEELAEYAHIAWSGWMKYLFKKGRKNPDGSFSIEPESVQRWTRQMNTPYAALTEIEKESDRDEANKVMAILNI